MKRKIFLILFLCVCVTLIQAQLLWEISGNNLKTKSYLFGTHHLVPVSFLDSIPGIYPAFNHCKVVVGEIVANDPTMVQKMTEAAKMPVYTNYHTLFSEEEYHLVDSALQVVLKMNLSDLALLKPAMINNLYIVSLYNMRYPTENQNWQLDSFFQQVANKKKTPVIGLESIDKQIDILFNLQSLERQAFLLAGTIKSPQNIETELSQLNDLYKKGDLNGLLSLYQNDTTIYAPTQQESYELLDNRNLDWSITIPKLIENKACFIAVGALHLPGENGLIALLRKAGYKVKPVKK